MPRQTRLADLLAGLSRLADLGFGLRPGDSVRSGALAAVLARSQNLPDNEVRAALYTALLHHVGCTAYAHETAAIFGDEITLNIAAGRQNQTQARDLFTTFLPTLVAGLPPLDRAQLVLTAMIRGPRFARRYTTAACEVGRSAARRLGLPVDVQRGVYSVYELWRGRGSPGGLAGEEIPLPSRIARLTGIAVLFESIAGVDAAVTAVRQRAGGMLDPGLAAHFADHAEALFAEVGDDARSAVLTVEPDPPVTVPDARITEVARVFGDLADLKSPHLHGHSSGVASLATRAGALLGLPARTVADLELAGLLHDVGRVAVPGAIWDKPGPLTSSEWEQVRLHGYHSERVVAGSARLAPIALLVGTHHERLDGSGYHRGCRASELPIANRVLAAADAYRAMTQDRPYRPARALSQAADELLRDGLTGRLDADAVGAVLRVAGRSDAPRRSFHPGGLTDREIEVLRLVARGMTNAQIADRLVISRRTAEHHVQHVYAKIGVSSRAAAVLFALEHGLLPLNDG